jgi:protocatechuate 3,4-dioxygenase beta subunit
MIRAKQPARVTRCGACLLLLSLSACGQEKPAGKSPKAAVAQTRTVGGGCDGCELVYAGMPQYIPATDTAPDWAEPGTKLHVSGTVFKSDGNAPAPGVILYYYHTDSTGRYTQRPGHETRHGYIRGWVKTGVDGRYAIYTNRPAPYPGGTDPAHIHIIVKEPQLNEYWVDELVFDDDSLLTEGHRSRHENRGGSGILRVKAIGDMQLAEHDIVLGLNIPDYPRRQIVR